MSGTFWLLFNARPRIVSSDCSVATGSRWIITTVASGYAVSSGPSCSLCWFDFSIQRWSPGNWWAMALSTSRMYR